MHCVMWRSSFFTLYQSGPVYHYVVVCSVHGLGRSTCSGIDALPSFPGASTISSPPRFVVEIVFRKSGVLHSFEMVEPVLFVRGLEL